VPSVFHSSRPLTPSDAWKNSQSFTAVSKNGDEEPAPGKMSATRIVPAA
jgi:hypothetical protein